MIKAKLLGRDSSLKNSVNYIFTVCSADQSWCNLIAYMDEAFDPFRNKGFESCGAKWIKHKLMNSQGPFTTHQLTVFLYKQLSHENAHTFHKSQIMIYAFINHNLWFLRKMISIWDNPIQNPMISSWPLRVSQFALVLQILMSMNTYANKDLKASYVQMNQK